MELGITVQGERERKRSQSYYTPKWSEKIRKTLMKLPYLSNVFFNATSLFFFVRESDFKKKKKLPPLVLKLAVCIPRIFFLSLSFSVEELSPKCEKKTVVSPPFILAVS